MNTKSAVITGSSRGIGEAIAIEFAKEGYDLVINSRDQEELSISKQEIIRAANSSTRVVTFPGDISEEEVCIGIIDTAAQEFGTIDVLVNNAGINGPEKVSPEITTKEWDEVLDINLKGCFMCSREAIKKMLNQKERRDGRGDYSTINISSVHESTPMPLAAPYAASKGGMEILTKTLAVEVADKRIRINSIAPGAIATMMNVDILEDEQKRKDEELNRNFNPYQVPIIIILNVAQMLMPRRSKLLNVYAVIILGENLGKYLCGGLTVEQLKFSEF